jgi:hypothetical protein
VEAAVWGVDEAFGPRSAQAAARIVQAAFQCQGRRSVRLRGRPQRIGLTLLSEVDRSGR